MTFERRAHARVGLRVPVLLIRRGWPQPLYVWSQTENVSLGGFCCQTNESLSLGEHLEFVLIFPEMTRSPGADMRLYLRGDCEVARLTVDSLGGGVGIGVRIQSFTVSTELDRSLPEGASLSRNCMPEVASFEWMGRRPSSSHIVLLVRSVLGTFCLETRNNTYSN